MYVTDTYEAETLSELVSSYVNDDMFLRWGAATIQYLRWDSSEGQQITFSQEAVRQLSEKLDEELVMLRYDNEEWKQFCRGN